MQKAQTQQQRRKTREKDSTVPIICRLTAANLKPYTKESYERVINRFLDYHKIAEVEPLRVYPLQ
jgi:hypothetical protein